MKLPLAPEGLDILKILLSFAIAGYILGHFSRFFYALSAISLALFVFSVYFFRDPQRLIINDDLAVLSPADGTVFEVNTTAEGTNVRIFMSPLNVHVQRAPVTGTVKKIEYKEGRFMQAYRPEAAQLNEQNILTLESAAGRFRIKQIAGTLARRIVCRVKEGDTLEQGCRWGMIKFGSQVDIDMPAGVAPKVKTGDKLKAGITVIGYREAKQ